MPGPACVERGDIFDQRYQGECNKWRGEQPEQGNAAPGQGFPEPRPAPHQEQSEGGEQQWACRRQHQRREYLLDEPGHQPVTFLTRARLTMRRRCASGKRLKLVFTTPAVKALRFE